MLIPILSILTALIDIALVAALEQVDTKPNELSHWNYF